MNCEQQPNELKSGTRMEHSSSVDVVSEAGQKYTDVMGKQGIMMLCLLLFFLFFFFYLLRA